MTFSTVIHCPHVASFIPRESFREFSGNGLNCFGVWSLILCAFPRKLILFLKKQSPSNGVTADTFIDHLVSRRHSAHKSRDVIGEELTIRQINEDVTENFPHLPDLEREVVPLPATKQRGRRDAMKLKALSVVSEASPFGSPPPHIIYLLEIGFNLDQIKAITQKDPYFAYHSLEEKIRPLVEFLLDIGVSKSDLPSIVARCPQLCGLSLSENVIPKIEFLETLGVDKTKWGKVISRFPSILGHSRQKFEATVQFLYEMGLSEELTGKLITNYPVVIGLSIEGQLRPKAKYFQSLGVDIALVLRRSPHIMGLSMEAKLKPITEFFLQNGFSREDVGMMISKFTRLYTFSLKGNLVSMWEFFLTMDYSRSDLLKYPNYFGFNLEERIKPRYLRMKESGVNLSLCLLLSTNPDQFEVLLEKEIKKLQLDK